MSDTLEVALRSVLDQIDEHFEIIVVDDGSSDESKKILSNLALQHQNLKYFDLPRDPQRKLGLTRNYSISMASGEWCIFHIDMDDFIGPHIKSFVKVVESIDKRIGKDMLYSGQQIHMGRRNFLSAFGPFRNIYRGEDRDLYSRLIKTEQWLVLKHERFIHRQTRSWFRLFKKNLHDNIDQMATDLSHSRSAMNYLKASFENKGNLNWKILSFRILALPVARLVQTQRQTLDIADVPSHPDFINYRRDHTYSYSELVEKWGVMDVREELPRKSREIFY